MAARVFSQSTGIALSVDNASLVRPDSIVRRAIIEYAFLPKFAYHARQVRPVYCWESYDFDAETGGFKLTKEALIDEPNILIVDRSMMKMITERLTSFVMGYDLSS